MRWSLKNKILKMWVDNGIIKNEVLCKPQSDLWKTAEKFAKAIATMDGSDVEKIHFAEGITKIFPEKMECGK